MAHERRVDHGAVGLSALLSQALVAFVIECDIAFEHALAHRTTDHGAPSGAEHAPWLVSFAMWVHCLRHVSAEGISTRDLARAGGLDARTARIVFTRMSAWWGYLTIDSVAAGDGSGERVRRVRPTDAGRAAQTIWAPLTDTIEDRWRTRHGAGYEALRSTAGAFVSRLDVAVPDYPPLGGQVRAWRNRAPVAADRGRVRVSVAADRGRGAADEQLPIWAALSKLLIVFAAEFDADAAVPIVLSANVVRAIEGDGVQVRELPRLTGLAAWASTTSSRSWSAMATSRSAPIRSPGGSGGRV